MPVIIVGTEKNFTELRSRLFTGRVSNARVQEITEAVVEANPHVDLKALKPGTILTIPDSPHLSVSGDISLDDSTKELIDAVAQAGSAALDDLATTAKAAEREAAAERKQVIATLARPELDAVAKKDAAFAEDLKAVKKAVDDDEARAKNRTAALQEATTSWNAELESLKGLLG
jgi:NADH dehydrogenase/NADH:ubiquinone oxidoreductase subunit G